MHQSLSGLNVSDVIDGFLRAKLAEGRSPRTIVGYRHDLRVWLAYAGDQDVAVVTAQDIQAFLNYLRTDYKPRRFSADTKALSPKTIRNFWVSLAALFRWLNFTFELASPMAKVPAPTFTKAEIEPFSQDEVVALLKACDFKREARPALRRRYTMRRATAPRDRAILLMLLDTGLRSSELCALNLGDVDLKTGKILVRGGPTGGAKAGKSRIVYMGTVVRRSLWRYLVNRDDKDNDHAPLFTANQHSLNRDSLRHLVARLGAVAQIRKCHPHRFRHTFAITYLRCGGDVFSLQRLLGHGSLEMVQHYARLAQVDIEQAHRRASPADNWRL
jgi:integrase/recombinase XerD